MYISPDTKHKALCATQIVICTTTYAAATWRTRSVLSTALSTREGRRGQFFLLYRIDHDWCDTCYKITYLSMTVKKKIFQISALLFGISIIIELSPLKNSLFVKLILVAPSFYKRTKRIVIYLRHAYHFSHFTFLS